MPTIAMCSCWELTQAVRPEGVQDGQLRVPAHLLPQLTRHQRRPPHRQVHQCLRAVVLHKRRLRGHAARRGCLCTGCPWHRCRGGWCGWPCGHRCGEGAIEPDQVRLTPREAAVSGWSQHAGLLAQRPAGRRGEEGPAAPHSMVKLSRIKARPKVNTMMSWRNPADLTNATAPLAAQHRVYHVNTLVLRADRKVEGLRGR